MIYRFYISSVFYESIFQPTKRYEIDGKRKMDNKRKREKNTNRTIVLTYKIATCYCQKAHPVI